MLTKEQWENVIWWVLKVKPKDELHRVMHYMNIVVGAEGLEELDLNLRTYDDSKG